MVTTQLMKAIDEVSKGKVYMPTSIATKFLDEFHDKVQQSTPPHPTLHGRHCSTTLPRARRKC
jgi:DNA-binding NarL/FixJ family response regulator